MKDKTGKTLTLGEFVNKVLNRIDNIMLELAIFILHVVGFIPLHHIRRFFYRLSGMKIGRGTTIHMGTRFFEVENIVVGKDTIIGEDAFLDGRAKIFIGDHVDISSSVMIYNSKHDINDKYFQAVDAPVTIHDYVFIGPRAIILPGVTIGKAAVVAAGAVVTKDVKDFAIVGGVPAKVIGERKNKDVHYKLGRARWFR